MRKIRKQRVILWVARGMGKTGRQLKESLAAALPDKQVLMVRSASKRFKQRDSDTIINWGNRNQPAWFHKYVSLVNGLNAVSNAVNKLDTFQTLEGKVNIPEWTTDPQQAHDWQAEGHGVIGRYLLESNSGRGIFLFNEETRSPLTLPPCRLYTKYKKKKHEYRVHVFNGEVIDICQKRKRRDYEGEINTKIRNIDGGWIFAREDLVVPADLEDQAVRAVEALGLDFGAVDIIWNKRENKSFVLEINTAPGLVGTSLARYTQAIVESLE